MKIRVITSIIALVVFICVLLAPPIVFTLALSAVILFMLYECYRATKADMAMKIVGLASAIMMIYTVGRGFAVLNAMVTIFLIAVIAFIILMYMALVIIEHGRKGYKEILSNAFLTLYLVISMGSIWLARELYGTLTMLLIFICAWATDTSAYFAGRFFGKHKLIPRVSPNKTVEGSIGGIIGAAAVCVIYFLIAHKISPSGFNMLRNVNSYYIFVAIYGVLGGLLSQAGDLAASAIKRDSDIKDFGWIFPGHGGFMDRFDSVMYIAPILHLLMMIFTLI